MRQFALLIVLIFFAGCSNPLLSPRLRWNQQKEETKTQSAEDYAFESYQRELQARYQSQKPTDRTNDRYKVRTVSGEIDSPTESEHMKQTRMIVELIQKTDDQYLKKILAEKIPAGYRSVAADLIKRGYKREIKRQEDIEKKQLEMAIAAAEKSKESESTKPTQKPDDVDWDFVLSESRRLLNEPDLQATEPSVQTPAKPATTHQPNPNRSQLASNQKASKNSTNAVRANGNSELNIADQNVDQNLPQSKSTKQQSDSRPSQSRNAFNVAEVIGKIGKPEVDPTMGMKQPVLSRQNLPPSEPAEQVSIQEPNQQPRSNQQPPRQLRSLVQIQNASQPTTRQNNLPPTNHQVVTDPNTSLAINMLRNASQSPSTEPVPFQNRVARESTKPLHSLRNLREPVNAQASFRRLEELANPISNQRVAYSQHDSDEVRAWESVARELESNNEKPQSIVDWKYNLSATIAAIKEASEKDGDDSAQHAKLQLYLRLLNLIEANKLDGIQQIPELSEDDRKFWSHQLIALARLLPANGKPLSPVAKSAEEAILELKHAVEELSEKAPMNVTELELCTEVIGFGQFVKFDSYDFAPQQQALIYCELENHTCEKVNHEGQLKLKTDLLGRYIIRDSQQRIVHHRKYEPVSDISTKKRNDFYMYFPFEIPNLPDGEYMLNLDVSDLNSNKIATSKPITFKVINEVE